MSTVGQGLHLLFEKTLAGDPFHKIIGRRGVTGGAFSAESLLSKSAIAPSAIGEDSNGIMEILYLEIGPENIRDNQL